MKDFFSSFTAIYANDVDALNPEWWAREGLAVLEEKLVVANLVNKDYSDMVASAGQTVHVHKAGTFNANHKVAGASTTAQDVTYTDTLVKLNQHIETTFHIGDTEQAYSLIDLREKTLIPAIRSIAEGIDRTINGEVAQLTGNVIGELGEDLDANDLIDFSSIMDENNVPEEGRILVVGSAGKANLFKIDRFNDFDKTGVVSPLLNGKIGDIMGLDVFHSQTVGRALSEFGITTAEVADGGELAGATNIEITAAAAGHTVGTWFKIAGVVGVYRVAAAITQTSSTDFDFTPALKSTVGTSAAITFYESAGVVDGAVTTADDDVKVVTDGYTTAAHIPAAGQGVSFGTSVNTSNIYTVVRVKGTYADANTDITLVLNRPLDADVGDGLAVNVMPTAGSYNLGFRSDAITLVNRPLAPAAPGSGAASVVMDNGTFALRVTIGYDMDIMKHKITVDTLMGVRVLDKDQTAVLLN